MKTNRTSKKRNTCREDKMLSMMTKEGKREEEERG